MSRYRPDSKDAISPMLSDGATSSSTPTPFFVGFNVGPAFICPYDSEQISRIIMENICFMIIALRESPNRLGAWLAEYLTRQVL